MTHQTWKSALLALALFVSVSVLACSVPVFRYALEHWKADAYQAVVFHRGPLTEAQRTLVSEFSTDGLAGRLRANISFRTVDLDDKPASDMLELARQSGATTFPWLTVKTPVASRNPAIIYSAPLAEKTAAQLLDSPARRELARRLGQGESAVWLLLESGNREQDSAAAKLLETRLAYLGTTLTLPKLDAQDIVKGLVSVAQEDLKLEFSILRLARTAPEEKEFIQVLLGTEPDLATVKEPIVFPVFGRGRSLYALVGAGIKRETIDQAATFLIGKCSCQVKEQNPGADLLCAADWDKLLKASASALPDLPSAAELAKLAPVTVTITGGADSRPTTTSTKSWTEVTMVNGYDLLGIAAAALAVAGLRLQRKANRAGEK